MTTVDEARAALLDALTETLAADWYNNWEFWYNLRHVADQLLDDHLPTFEAAVRAESEQELDGCIRSLSAHSRALVEPARELAALREAAMAVNDAFGAMFVDGAYQATQKRIDALNRLQDALAVTPAEESR